MQICDQFQIEDARHMIIHCPNFQDIRDEMMTMIDNLGVEVRNAIATANIDILYILLGYTLVGLDVDLMDKIRMISLKFIPRIYHLSANKKKGIG